MKRFFLFLFGIVLCLGGCEQSVQEPAEAWLGGLKLSDIAPTYRKTLPKQIDFRIFTFELPATEYGKVKDVFGGLMETPLHFNDRRGFGVNDFAVGFGQNKMWNVIADKLRDNSAKKVETEKLIVFDDKGDDITVKKLGYEKNVFYTQPGGSVTGATVGGGEIVWRIKARHIPTISGTIEVSVDALFKKNFDLVIRRMVGMRDGDEIVFDSAGFNLKMSKGDFVLLGPADTELQELSLAELFFSRRGKFILPTAPEEKQKKSIIQKPKFTLYKDVALVRLYLIVCAGVGN